MAKVFLRAYNREIETMIDRGQLDEAIAHCHHVLKTFPKHLETYRLLGKAYLEAKRYGDAVDIFSRIIASVPSDFVAQVGMSIIRDEENKLDDAIWHMERAFETQPSNAAIQSELQRLYGRRDGVQPPRIRITRGALAHMYVQGELYPQAISEIKSVLAEDPGRSDMQALLARAYFKSGAKNDAVDAALALLQRHPYSFDANRVLVEILSADRNENAAAYRQRVVELDPYAAQVMGSTFLANEVSDAAVALERLDWNGQPVGMQSDWRENQAIGLESGATRNEQPDWLKNSFGEAAPPPSQPETGSMFEAPAASSVPPAQPTDEIPDFMKAAGWGQSTGAFDESKPLFGDDEPSSSAESIAQGDLPDWIKAMKPAEPESAAQEQEEELPDWINKIGTGALSTSDAATTTPDWMDQPAQEPQSFGVPAGDEPDWMKSFDQPASSSEEQPDWMKGLGSESDFAPQPAQTDTPDWLKGPGDEPEATDSANESDWLKGLGESDSAPQPAQTDTPDWLKGLGNESEPTPAAQADDLDWLKDVTSEPQSGPAISTDDSEWLKQFGAQTESAAATSNASKDFDFLHELTQEPVIPAPEPGKIEDLVMSAQEQDDSFAWLEDLAVKQGASEDLLTKPEERLQDEPEWVRQAKDISSEPPTPPSQPAANVEELGKSEQEQDDSFAWLESLAAKQGASEGLLTKPEERLEEEPEWVKQAKGLTSESVSQQSPANVQELGKSEQERDDSFAWLESLAAKQGASEGLLTKPEERLEEEPEWVRQAKSVPGEPPVFQEPPVLEPAVNVEELGKSEQEQDDSFAWLEGLAAKQGASEGLLTQPEERLEEEPEWVKQSKSVLSEPSVAQPPVANVEELGKSEKEQDDSFAWLESLAAKQGASEGLLTKPEERLEEEPEWVKQAKYLGIQQTVSSAPQPEPIAEQPATDDAPSWLKNRDTEEEQPTPVSVDETPDWLKDIDQEEKRPEPAADETAMWLKNLDQTESAPAQASAEPVIEQPSSVEETPSWLKGLEEEDKPFEPAADETAMWFKNLDQPEVAESSIDDDMPAWMQNIEQQETTETEPAVHAEEVVQSSESELPSWLSELEKEEASIAPPANAEDLPAWLRDDTGELIAEPDKIEPTRSTDWRPFEEPRQPEIIYSPPLDEPKEPEIVYSPALEETPQPEPEKPLPPVSFEPPQQELVATPPPPQEQPKPEPRPIRKPPSKPTPAPEHEARPPVMPGVDQTLGSARSELSRSNIPGALDSYAKLIKKGRFLDEVIYDLRDALYRYPVEVSIWQSLGDAYMRANRLQDALDAYTKAEELLR